MEHRENNPGAVQYGNFKNYYQFNSAGERIKLLPSTNIWLASGTMETQSSVERKSEPYLVLDVGCNCGDFTQLLQSFLEEQLQRPVHVLGVDIDERLIERAELNNKCPGKISYFCDDILNASTFDVTVLQYLQQHRRNKFDAICCYSITMWIHLNHHDSGLQLFLRKLSQLSELFVVEPQPWKCYQTAERRLKKAGEVFPMFVELKWRSDVEQQIQRYLQQELGRNCVYESTPTKWQRKICFYR
ncbi:probable RNA methyltransferase CG11342 [Drosophila grimshawi]|uniref:RNA methyltransferase n=1 Tax=Drosophila grimshawi TaxID=7222 RepID=B4IZP4_DROGR|nr:probable RNA methyltransferase CG11342 [Drosophila grimshawi]EDV95629.1 GH15816 [Drosophila grimshawi]